MEHHVLHPAACVGQNLFKNRFIFSLVMLIGLMFTGGVNAANGDILFTQNFDAATAVPYVANTTTAYTTSTGGIFGSGANQFTSCTGIAKGTCGFAINSTTNYPGTSPTTGNFANYGNNTSYYWSLERTTNFATTAPTAIKMAFDIYFYCISSGSNQGVNFAIGSGLTDGYNTSTLPSASLMHSAFSISSNSTAMICTYGSATTITGSSTLTSSTWKSMVWVMNNTGASLSYTDPSNGTSTLADDKWDLWMGTTRIVTAAPATTAAGALQQIYIGLNSGKRAELRLDNIVITDLSPAPLSAPTTQANTISFSNITATSMTAAWTRGNGSNVAVFMKDASGAITNPSDNTSYTASSNWNSGSPTGTQLGSSGYYCVYNGSSTSVNLTNLQVGHTYYLQAFEYNGTGGTEKYYTATATGNPNNQLAYGAPTATTGSASSISTTGASLAGTINAQAASTTVTFDYGSSVSYGSSVTAAESPVSGISNTSVSGSLSGLTPNTLYHFRLKGVNSAGTTNGSDATFTTLPDVPTVGTGDTQTPTGFTAHWTAPATLGTASYTYRVQVTATSGNYSSLAAEVSSISSGNLSQAITGLTVNTPYYFRVRAENVGGVSAWSSESAEITTLNLSAPTLSTTSISAITVSGASSGGNISSNGGDALTARGLVYNTSSPAETAGTTVAEGGTSTGSYSQSLTGLNANTLYYVKAYATNSVGTSYGSEVSFTTLATEPTTASTVSFGTKTSTSLIVNFSGGDGSRRIVVARQGAAPTSVPTDGTTYTANTAYGTGGTALGDGYVVYDGTDATVTVTALTTNTTYYFAVYEYNNNSASSPNYYSTAGTGSARTLNTAKAITAFTITGQLSSTIDENAKTIAISVPQNTNLTSITSSAITLSDYATVSPLGSASIDFTNTVTYTVTAEDGSTQDYSVSVTSGTSTTDYFKSRATGVWSASNTWQSSINGTDWINATSAPTQTATSVSIQNGFTVTVDAATTIPTTTVDATSTLKATATVTLGSGKTLTVNGVYEHSVGGSSISLPTATWNTGSILKISGSYSGTPSLPGSPTSHYKSIWIDCTAIGTDLNSYIQFSNSYVIDEKLKIVSTGSGAVLLVTSGTNSNTSVLSANSFEQTGGNTIINRNASSGTRSLTVTNNTDITSGTMYLKTSGGSTPGTLNVGGNLTIGASATIKNDATAGSSAIVFNGTNQSFSNAGTILITGSGSTQSITVNATSILDLGSNTFGTSASTFTTVSGATLKTAHTSGINGNITVTGTKTLDVGTNYIFNSSSVQATGALLTTANNIEIANSVGVSLSGDITVNGTLTLTSGTLDKNGHTITYGSNASVNVTGGSVEIPTTIKNLTIDKLTGQSLSAPTTVSGTLTLTTGTLDNSSNQLTLDNGATLIINGGTLASIPTFVTSVNLTYNGTSVKGNEFPASNIINTLNVNNTAGISLTDNRTIPTLSIGSGSKINVEAGKQLTVSTSLTNAGNIALKSDVNGTATLVNNGTFTNSGSATVQQYLATTRNWYVSSPVSNAKLPADFTCYQYIEPGDNTGFVAPASLYWKDISEGITLTPGIGYIAKPTGEATLTFSTETGGHLNDGDITVDLTKTASATKSGFNLVGNPYPSYVYVNAVVNSNRHLEKTVWYRTRTTGDTPAYLFESVNTTTGEGTQISGTAVTGVIPPMQAFWVKTDADTTLTFTNAMRYHANPTINAATVTTTPLKLRSTEENVRRLMRLQVSNGTNRDETILMFDANASNAFDAYDSQKMLNNSASVPDLFTTVGTNQLVINGMNDIPYNTEILLGFAAGQVGTYTLKASELRNFDTETAIILRDNMLNTETLLTPESEYSFASDVTNTTSRFSVIFKTSGAVTGFANNTDNKQLLYLNNSNTLSLNVTGEVSGDSYVTVFNALGQQIVTKPIVSGVNEFREVKYDGVYILKGKINGTDYSGKINLNR